MMVSGVLAHKAKKPALARCHRGELALVVDHERATFTTESTSVESATCCGSILEFGVNFQDDMVLLQGSVHRRDDALAEGVVERVVDRAGQDAVARGDVALDGDVEQRSGIELVGGDVGDARHRLDRIIYFFERQFNGADRTFDYL